MKSGIGKDAGRLCGLISLMLSALVHAQWTPGGTAGYVNLTTTTNNVGIGTTGAPAAKLEVSNSLTDFNLSFMRLSNPNTKGQTALDFYISGALKGKVRTDYAGNLSLVANGGGIDFYTGGDWGTGTRRLRLLSDGKFGIGTTPTAALDVVGDFKDKGNASFTGSVDINGGKTFIWPWDNNISGVPTPPLTIHGPVGIAHRAGEESMGLAFAKGTFGSFQSGKYFNWTGQGVTYYNASSEKRTSFCSLGLIDMAYEIYSPSTYKGPSLLYSANGYRLFYIDANGCVSIVPPSTSYPALNVQGHAKVNGTLSCKELVVTMTPAFPDYVFEKNYKLQSLSEIQSFISKEKHLPGMPTAENVKKSGVNVGELQVLLLKKVEEITLHLIELNNENDSLKTQMAELKAKLQASR